MSLINQMLQDLDARGTPGVEAGQVYVKPVARAGRRLPNWAIGAALAGAVVVGGGGALGWHYLKKPAAPASPRPVMVVMTPPAARPVPAPAPVVVTPAPPAAVLQAPEPKQATRPADDAQPVLQAANVETDAESRPAARKHKAKAAERDEPAKAAAHKRKLAAAEDVAPEPKAVPETAQREAAAVDKRPTEKRAAADEGRQESTSQRAENAYRRALADLQEGRVTDAIAGLQRALQAEPKHEAARQTLVGLLVESRRNAEAIRQLQLGLTIDPRQPALAMLLARLQIEGGGSGIETLTRTLPYASGNGEYHALLAGALERQQRHREAAEQYQAALRAQGRNGVWWMGLGIALQADKRDAEAMGAYQKALEAGTLSPELQAFVERRLAQLNR